MKRHIFLGARPLRRSAFTLVELLVVIFIISLLISLLLPALAMARRLALAVVCESNMRQTYLSYAMYADDYGGFLPASYGPAGGAANYLTGLPEDPLGPHGTGSQTSWNWHLPAASLCPQAVAMNDSLLLNSRWNDGTYQLTTYMPDYMFWYSNMIPGTYFSTVRINSPDDGWPPAHHIVAPGDAILLGEMALPSYLERMGLSFGSIQYGPQTWSWTAWRLGWYHGSGTSYYMNVAYFDGHIGRLNIPPPSPGGSGNVLSDVNVVCNTNMPRGWVP